MAQCFGFGFCWTTSFKFYLRIIACLEFTKKLLRQGSIVVIHLFVENDHFAYQERGTFIMVYVFRTAFSSVTCFFQHHKFVLLLQAVHRHTPVLIRALGSSYSELLQIISDPPQGSEQLLTQVVFFKLHVSYLLKHLQDCSPHNLTLNCFT